MRVLASFLAVLYLNLFQTLALSYQAKIHPDIHRLLLANNNLIDVFIEMNESAQAARRWLQEIPGISRGEQLAVMTTSLNDHARRSQKQLEDVVHDYEQEIGRTLVKKRFWITNEFFIGNADHSLLKKIAHLPSVRKIRHYTAARIPATAPASTISTAGVSTCPSNGNWHRRKPKPWFVKNGFQDAWDQNITGEGVIVASIDTGARVTHEAIADQFLGDNGWYDPVDNTDVPFDDVNHGTGVLGTLLGKDGFGAAPGAKWMSCRACESNSLCSRQYLLACAEYIVCPEKAENGRCLDVPQVVVNSWYNHDHPVGYFDDVFATWKKAGIFAIFAAGNALDNQCGSIHKPTDLDSVFTVGNVGFQGDIHPTSALGPTEDGRIKPDIVAPGRAFYSLSSKSDCALMRVEGTSFAAPVVAGAVALLLQVNNRLKLHQIDEILRESASDEVDVTAHTPTCGDVHPSTFPNNVFGHGVLSVTAALDMVTDE